MIRKGCGHRRDGCWDWKVNQWYLQRRILLKSFREMDIYNEHLWPSEPKQHMKDLCERSLAALLSYTTWVGMLSRLLNTSAIFLLDATTQDRIASRLIMEWAYALFWTWIQYTLNWFSTRYLLNGRSRTITMQQTEANFNLIKSRS